MAENKQQDTNKLLQVRRDKLAELQAAGKDPFEITKYDVKNLQKATTYTFRIQAFGFDGNTPLYSSTSVTFGSTKTQ